MSDFAMCDEEGGVILPPNMNSIYNINNHLYFYKEINEESAALFNKGLTEMYFDIVHTMINTGLRDPEIEIHLNSPGGTINGAMAMVKKIKELKKGIGIVPVPMKVITHVEGEAASAATIVSIMGDHRTIDEYSVMLVHEVLGGVIGKKSMIDDYTQNLELQSRLVKTLYKKNTKMDDKILEKIINRDILLDAETCLKYRLVDEIL